MSPVRQIKRALVGEAAIREPSPGAGRKCRHDRIETSESVPPERNLVPPGRRRDDLENYVEAGPHLFRTSQPTLGDIQPPTPSWGGPKLGTTPERTMSPVRQIKRALVGEAAIREPSPGARRKCRHDRIETSESVPPERNLVPPGRRRDDLENYVEAGPHLFRTSQPTLGDIQPPTPSWGGPPSGPDPGENHEPGETNKTSPCRRGRN